MSWIIQLEIQLLLCSFCVDFPILKYLIFLQVQLARARIENPVFELEVEKVERFTNERVVNAL